MMPIEKITHKLIIEVDNRNGRHKVKRQGVVRDDASPLQDTPFTEPVKRIDLETIISSELAMTAETITRLSNELDAATSALLPVQEELATVKAELNALKNPPAKEYPDLSAEQFWTAAEIKLGIDQDAALAFVGQMPSSTEAEIEAKVLVKNLVLKGTKFEIDHPALQGLVMIAGISQTQLKAAWAYGLTVKY